MIKSIHLTLLFLFVFSCNYAQNNGVSILIGYGGGDGIDPGNIYGIEYTRFMGSKWNVYVKYNQSSVSYDRYRRELPPPFVGSKNESDAPNDFFVQFYSIGFGTQFYAAKTEKSNLHLILGLRHAISYRTFINGTIGDPSLGGSAETSYRSVLLSPEMGIGYTREFREKYLFGGRLTYMEFQSRIAFSTTFGVKF